MPRIKSKPVQIPNFSLSGTSKMSTPKPPPTSYELQVQFETYANAKVAKESSDSDELMKLSTNMAKSVRFWVANNRNTPPEALDLLSRDKSYTIVAAVAQNENTPAATILRLTEDGDSDISMRAKITHKKQVIKLIKLWEE